MKRALIEIDPDSAVPKYRQVIDSLIAAIEFNRLHVGDKLPSIRQLCEKSSVKRDTLMYALNELKSRGIITSRQGKGYYVASTDVHFNLRYLMLFDELNSYTGNIYNTFVRNMPKDCWADVFFHHYEPARIQELLTEKNAGYTSFIIASAGLNDFDEQIKKIPLQRSCFIGKPQNGTLLHPVIYHDHEKDTYEALRSMKKNLKKFCRLVFLNPDRRKYPGRVEGFLRFCTEENLNHFVCENSSTLRPALYEAYFVSNNNILASLIGQIRSAGMVLGETAGVVTFGDSLMAEVAEGGLTAIEPDFTEICLKLLEITNGQKRGAVRVRSKVIQRNSL